MQPTAPADHPLLILYPPAPILDDTTFLDPSPAFRQQVRRTLFGILGFIMLYLLLVGFGVALGYVCVLSTIMLVSLSINKFTLIIGLGLLTLGLMFLLFLVKFLFAVYKNQNTQRVEITTSDHPNLVAFIHKLADDVHAPKPHRIFLSPDVNACVFYNSSFWSLFIPVKKNLEIGLGLVNSLNMTEFKAVMAHEFGHFSQRSMKLGSYVYIVNRVIYNLVYDRDRWDALLEKWANSGGVWSIFAGLTQLLVNLVRRVLAKAYEWLNLRYMGLSREMEYQADLVAVSATGAEPVVTALRRIELGNAAYQQMLGNLNELIGESKIAENIYPLHSRTIQMLAAENKIELIHGLPVLTDELTRKMMSASRVNYQDQWSSHPGQAEREENIRTVPAPCNPDTTSPWLLFNKPDYWQKELTARLYAGVELENPTNKQRLTATDYATHVADQIKRDQLPELYNGFYDSRLLFHFDPKEVAQDHTEVFTQKTLFSDENLRLRKKLATIYEEQNVLEQIKSKQIQTRTFDFDGKKYDRREVDQVLAIIRPEMEALQAHFQKTEEDAFRLVYRKALQQGLADELIRRYELYFRLNEDRETYGQLLLVYSELLKNTHDALKDGGTKKRGMGRQIDEFNDKMQQAYRNSQTIDIPSQVGTLTFERGYAAHLCPDTLREIKSESFNWEDMVALYQQLEPMPNLAGQAQIAVLDELIRWQATLL
ncbi:M48 family metallopeptidase [Spirosoma radiotolerans]|uniref:Peptidase M48 domain-containing protein n=1 Tax=Spirosoma radiotolerans TaxID=1379870 RepID=A0A0E3ZU25_9BACT|nr:M48 family metallopeptidase [Spirosoma radiotolerans]AKD55355.1 hypothetical protein SD10_11050 [Spirosoma radiotolerans]